MTRTSSPEGQESPGNRGSQVLEVLVALLLVVAFFIGPLKLIGVAWLGYAIPDALALVALVFVFSERALTRRPLFVASPLTIPILLLSGMCVLQLVNPEAPFIRTVFGLRTWLLYVGFFFVGFYGFRSTGQIERLYGLLLALGCVTAVYGVYQWRAGPESFVNWSEQYGNYARIMWSAGAFRAFSTFILPNTFGDNMGLLMLIAFGVAASRRVPRHWRVAAGVSFALMGAGIAASGTRAPVVELCLAGAIGFTVLPVRSSRFRFGLTAIVLSIAAVILVVTTLGPAVNERFLSLLDLDQVFSKWFNPLALGLRIAVTHPFGMGLGYTGGTPQFIDNPVVREFSSKTIDSGYGSAAAELGLVGLLVFAYLAAKVGLEGVLAWRRLSSSTLRDLLLAPALFAALYPVVALIGGIHASLPGSIYFWLLIGILIRAPTLQKDGHADQFSPSQMHA